MSVVNNKPPDNEFELIRSCKQIAGLSFSQLAGGLGLTVPQTPSQRKGWLGQAVELALGTTAKNQSIPDFHHLGIELKTLPIGSSGEPVESTFITSIPLLTIHQENWQNSQCYNKLKRVLWLPVEGDTEVLFHQRRVGMGFIWSPSAEEEEWLKADWMYLTDMISTGRIEEINARHGDYLQIRPKAASAKSLCYAFDSTGARTQTLPRGFYLRRTFTNKLLKNQL